MKQQQQQQQQQQQRRRRRNDASQSVSFPLQIRRIGDVSPISGRQDCVFQHTSSSPHRLSVGASSTVSSDD